MIFLEGENLKLFNFSLEDFFVGDAENDGHIFLLNAFKIIDSSAQGSKSSFVSLLKIISEMKSSKRFKKNM